MNQDKNNVLTEIRKIIENAANIALFCHIRPDGDAIGSMLGLGWSLEEMGKKVQYVCPDELPVQGWLNPQTIGKNTRFVKAPEPYDCSVLLDVSTLSRAGYFFEQPDIGQPDICIDHHVSNSGDAKINLIDPSAPATAIIVAHLIEELNFPMNKEIAEALLSGIIMDTQGFSTSNTNPDSLRVTAKLMEQGADLYWGIQNILKAHSLEAAKYWHCGLSKLETRGKILWTVLTDTDRVHSGYTGRDDAGLIDYLASTEGFLATVLFNEQNDGRVKISWRSRPGVNVAAIAEEFGGGGHRQAAGADVNGPIEYVVERVLACTEKGVRSAEQSS